MGKAKASFPNEILGFSHLCAKYSREQSLVCILYFLSDSSVT